MTTYRPVAPAWRRTLVTLVAVAVAFIAIAALEPTRADARQGADEAMQATFKGWTHLRPALRANCNANGCTTPTYPAWWWTGSEWMRTRVEAGTQVYAWPYASGYTWVWTRYQGWLAIDTSRVELPRYR